MYTHNKNKQEKHKWSKFLDTNFFLYEGVNQNNYSDTNLKCILNY